MAGLVTVVIGRAISLLCGGDLRALPGVLVQRNNAFLDCATVHIMTLTQVSSSHSISIPGVISGALRSIMLSALGSRGWIERQLCKVIWSWSSLPHDLGLLSALDKSALVSFQESDVAIDKLMLIKQESTSTVQISCQVPLQPMSQPMQITQARTGTRPGMVRSNLRKTAKQAEGWLSLSVDDTRNLMCRQLIFLSSLYGWNPSLGLSCSPPNSTLHSQDHHSLNSTSRLPPVC